MFGVCELLTQTLSRTGLVTWTSLSCHAWSKPSDERFLGAVQSVWRSVFGLDAADRDGLRALHRQLGAVENSPATAGTPVKQVQVLLGQNKGSRRFESQVSFMTCIHNKKQIPICNTNLHQRICSSGRFRNIHLSV